MKTLELSKVPNWLTRAERANEEHRRRAARWLRRAALALFSGLLCGAAAALAEFCFSR